MPYSSERHVLRAGQLSARLRRDQAVMAGPDRRNRNGRRLCFVVVELGKPCVAGPHLRETSSDKSSGEHAAVMRCADRNDPFDAGRPALPKVCPRDQASHAVAHEEDAGRACGNTYRLDLRAQLLRKVLYVAVRRAIVDGVDRIDSMPREIAPHGEPNAVVDQHAMHQNNG